MKREANRQETYHQSTNRNRRSSKAFLSNVRTARSLWGSISKAAMNSLREFTERHELSVSAGDLLLLEGRWYVTHAGLLRVSERKRCSGIRAVLQKNVSDPSSSRWVFKATVYKGLSSKGFDGDGEANPSIVSILE